LNLSSFENGLNGQKIVATSMPNNKPSILSHIVQ
jgi:hypothetical protein